MNNTDLNLCRDALQALTSKKNANKAYIFTEPVSIQEVPDYTSVIQKPMDLGTVGKNLESKQYATTDDFWRDISLTFENALQYHKGKKQTQWIVKLAKEMMKLVKKEKKVMEKKKTPKPKKTTTKTKPKTKTTAASGSSTGLKLKLSTGAAAKKETTTAAKGNPKLSLNLKPPATAAAPVAKKPKLKLNLSLKTKAAATPAVPPKLKLSAHPPSSASSAASRGKELPKGLASKGQKKKTSPKTSSKTTMTTLPKTAVAAQPPKKQAVVVKKPKSSSSAGMTEKRKASCHKVLLGLKRRKHQVVVWFLKPVTDKSIVDDYRAKIPHPMDLGTIANKLDNDVYPTVADFCLDVRRVFGNCLRFNTTIHDQIRAIGVDMMILTEELLAYFLGKPEAPQVAYPPLLYCWRLCVQILDTIYGMTEQKTHVQTAHYFMHAAVLFLSGSARTDYLNSVKQPMDFGTITSNLLEGRYQKEQQFASDCMLVITNCQRYYGNQKGADAQLYCDQAARIGKLVQHQLASLQRYSQTAQAKMLQSQPIWQTVHLTKPPVELLVAILTELRASQYVDKYTKLSEPAVRMFEKAVDVKLYTDYLQYVRVPICLEQIERKARVGQYMTPEDFEYDVNLVFKNCEAYNAPKKSNHMLALGKNASKTFKKICINRFNAWENPEKYAPPPVAGTAAAGNKRAPTPSTVVGQPPLKKSKAEAPTISISAAAAGGKKAPRISITAAAAAAAAASKAKKQSGPVPLHVAITRIKEGFPLRRTHKLLETWEEACSRFFRDLMKHPWISAAKPKFIFHVPVPTLFPDLKAGYAEKIKRPMDLTTVEAKLLQGGLYHSAQDFVDEVALIFANSITFNRAGRDEGDRLSIAYFDASIHLLKYTRWLSLEWLDPYLSDDPVPDELGEQDKAQGMPLSSWKLSRVNKNLAREEMEKLVLQEHIDKSFEGDRYTWQEAECEKLLKSLRHQSDIKYMHFFTQPFFPPDYTAYISRPIAWDNCNKALQKRQYDKFVDIIEDLRLIFTNATKYNAPHKGKDNVSGKAYDAAVIMSGKLETAIDRLLISVAERLGRERVDDAITQREHEAEEKLEEERLRNEIKQQEELDRAIGTDSKSVSGGLTQKDNEENIRIRNRRKARRDMDFEVPYFDDDEKGNQEQSHVELMKLQKETFERQKQQRAVSKKLSLSTGALVFARLAQCEQAQQWRMQLEEAKPKQQQQESEQKADDAKKEANGRLGSMVQAELNKAGRAQISIKPIKATKKRKRPIPKPLSLE